MLRLLHFSFNCDIHWVFFLLQTSKSPIFIKGFFLPMPFQFRKHERHNLPYDVKNYDVSAEGIKNCVKYIFVGRCLLIFLTRQYLI